MNCEPIILGNPPLYSVLRISGGRMSSTVLFGVAELRDAAIGDRDITKLEIMN
jgi:hypothetical protein